MERGELVHMGKLKLKQLQDISNLLQNEIERLTKYRNENKTILKNSDLLQRFNDDCLGNFIRLKRDVDEIIGEAIKRGIVESYIS
jgi:thiamine biosynthesis lipoprotein ApbE